MTRHLITSALPYINGVKHIGNLIGSLLPADVFARFQRQQGHEVLFICATDDHGTPAELGAIQENLSTADYCDKQYQLQTHVYQQFNLSFDHFGRTSRQQNIELTQHFAKKLKENAYIEERTIKQFYSPTDQRFLPDRYIEGTCPYCKFEHARGDQCENCTKVLDPEELINPRSAISGSTDIKLRETKHLFLLQSKLQKQIRAWVESNTHWPYLVQSIALKWLNEGLQDRCITRDLQWGVPVDWPGYENKVFYVWFDAPIGYIAATKEWSDLQPQTRNWKSWWYEAQDVTYTQFMAKDNVPFHTVSFPSTLIGSGEPWKKVDFIKGFNWLTYYGGKFSTSRHVGIFTADAIKLFPADYWRYVLLCRAPETSDASFTWEEFQALVNKDLCDVLGNLINRTLQFSIKHFGTTLPQTSTWTTLEKETLTRLEKHLLHFRDSLSQCEFRKAMTVLRQIWAEGNQYITEAAPWLLIKTDKPRTQTILNFTIHYLRIIAIISYPVIPESSEKIISMLNTTIDPHRWIADLKKEFHFFESGHRLGTPEILFKKIEDEVIVACEEKFKKP